MATTPPNAAQTQAALAGSAADARRQKRRASLLRTAILVVVLALVVGVVNWMTRGEFLTPGNLTNVLRQISVNAIMAVGQTFVIITAGIDLSVGSLVALCSVVMAIVANSLHLPAPLAFAVTLVVGIAVGCAAGWVNALPVVRLNLPPFITTLAMMQVARGLSYILARGQPIPLVDATPYSWLGIGGILAGPLGPSGIPYQVIVMAIVAIAFAVVLGRTAFGRYVLADGGNEEAARLAGVDVRRVKSRVYIISGACAALAGMLLMARFASGSPQNGVGYELQAIAAVVVGGTSLMGGRGSIIGTFFGALLIGVLNNVMDLLNIESYTQLIVLGAVILLAVIADEIRKRYLAAR